MNWRRGLIRLWVVFTVIWIVAVAFDQNVGGMIYAYRHPMLDKAEIAACVRERTGTVDKGNPYECLDAGMRSDEHPMTRSEATQQLGKLAGIAASGPIATLVAAFIVLWVGKGFRRDA